MATEAEFKNCIDGLDEVTEVFQRARNLPNLGSDYEADRSAYQLLEAVFRHINAVTQVAMIPYLGSHFISAIPLLRSAIECSLTAYWLVQPNEWVEREARWLGWMVGEEEHQRKLANDFRTFAPKEAESLDALVTRLNARRLAITRKLPKDSRLKRPSVFDLLKECGVGTEYYSLYRVGSQVTHGGPLVCHNLWDSTQSMVYPRSVQYKDWAEWLRMASWCLALSAPHVLVRMGVVAETANEIAYAHQRYILRVSVLDGRRFGGEHE